MSNLEAGDKVLGVKFSDERYPEVGWVGSMESYVGVEGVISHICGDGVAEIYFPDGGLWYYPLELLSKVEDN